jgi:hypothetical protein
MLGRLSALSGALCGHALDGHGQIGLDGHHTLDGEDEHADAELVEGHTE